MNIAKRVDELLDYTDYDYYEKVMKREEVEILIKQIIIASREQVKECIKQNVLALEKAYLGMSDQNKLITSYEIIALKLVMVQLDSLAEPELL